MNADSVPHTPAAAAKVDPETLVLRGSPRPVARFRRGLLVALAAAGSASIMAITWFALQPTGLRLAAPREDIYSTDRKAPPDGVTQLPGSYGETREAVPNLGPPLPGDLGRPILEHQRAQEAAAMEARSGADLVRQRQAAERDRKAAALRAAREGGLLAQISGSLTRSADAGAAGVGQVADAGGVEDDPAQRPRILASEPETPAASSHRLQPPASRWQLNAGTIIAANLLTGINSDVPGLVTAQVAENVADSATGRTVLIPQGSRLVGNYENAIAFGQSRALVVWERLVLPDGSSLQLDNAPASDAAGYAGLADKVDFHTGRLLKGIALSTLLGVGGELSLGASESELVRALKRSTQQNAEQTGQQIVARNLDVRPTITVRPGWPLRVVLHKDLILQPWKED